MLRRRRRTAGALLVAAVLLGAAVSWTVRGGAATAMESGPPTAPDRTVTLLTGDQITVSGSGGQRVSVRRGAGREKVSFLTRHDHGDLSVVPTDAVAPLAAGRVDPRLFDVTGLLRAAGADLPLVVESRAGLGRPKRVPSDSLGALWRDVLGDAAMKVRLDQPSAAAAVTDQETYELTIRYLDRAGRPATNYLSYVMGLDVTAGASPFDPSGTVTVRLPRGHYQIGAFLPNSADDPYAGTLMAQPVLDLTGARTVVMDARLARPVSVSVPEPTAVPVVTVIGFSETTADGVAGGDVYTDSPARMYTAQIGGDDEAFTSLVATGWRRTASGDSPYGYDLAYYQRGRMWTGIERHPTRRDLATVRMHQAQSVPGSVGTVSGDHSLAGVPWGWTWALPGSSGPLPAAYTQYYNTDAGVRWAVYDTESLPGDPYPTTVQWFAGAPVTYQPGRIYQEDWNKAVFAPAFPPPPDPVLWMTRTGDRMMVWPSWYADAAGRDGYSDSVHSTISLQRDGTPVGDVADSSFGEFTVPADTGRYRLEIAATRAAPVTLSTAIDTVWTFDSGSSGGDAPVALPLSAIRFAPPVDDQNSAPAGQAFAVPVVVASQPGSAAGPLAHLSVDVSYDDGTTWQHAGMRGDTALLRHPAAAGYVSLRATATDSSGDTVTQTVVHAYRLRAAS